MKTMRTLGVMLVAASMFQACTVFVGGHGHGHGSDWGWHHGGWHHGSGHLSYSAQEMSRDFGIRTESAQALLQAAQNDADEQQISKLGLESADLMALAQLQMPSRSGIEKVAKALNEEPSHIEKLTQSFVTDVQAQMNDVTSEYWTACIQSGHWTTPQNANCTKTYWDGCSPENGATSCEEAELVSH